MVETPDEKIDEDEFDSVEEYIAACMDAGYTIEAEDFEGRPCSYCGELLDFAEWMRDPDAVVTWDIRVHEPDEPEPEPYFARYYFCSEECRDNATRDDGWLTGETDYGEPNHIHEDDVEGHV